MKGIKMNAKQRAAVYVVAGAVMAILIAYDVVSESVAPLWLSLFAGVVGIAAPVTALRNLTPDES